MRVSLEYIVLAVTLLNGFSPLQYILLKEHYCAEEINICCRKAFNMAMKIFLAPLLVGAH